MLPKALAQDGDLKIIPSVPPVNPRQLEAISCADNNTAIVMITNE